MVWLLWGWFIRTLDRGGRTPSDWPNHNHPTNQPNTANHSVHGANYIYGATLFPQQINAAASFNRALVKEMGRCVTVCGCAGVGFSSSHASTSINKHTTATQDYGQGHQGWGHSLALCPHFGDQHAAAVVALLRDVRGGELASIGFGVEASRMD